MNPKIVPPQKKKTFFLSAGHWLKKAKNYIFEHGVELKKIITRILLK
jgi:hypothetical protein